MYTYRKPKNAEHAIELVKIANVNTLWGICDESQIELSQRYFELYQPIVFIYKKNKLVGAAHGKDSDNPTIIDINDRDITSTYNKLLLNEISIELKQLELF
jgi:hypothetical protein